MKQYFIFVGLLLFSHALLAENNVANTITKNTATQNTATKNTAIISSAANHAHGWGLSNAEWQTYQWLMQGANGHYYPKLTPPEVLGINADTVESLKHFADLTAQQEHDKVEKELRFNAAFQEAAKRLYANEPVIRPFDLTPYASVLAKP